MDFENNKTLFYSILSSTVFCIFLVLSEFKDKSFKSVLLVLLFFSLFVPAMLYGYAFLRAFLYNKYGVRITNEASETGIRQRMIATDLFLKPKYGFFRYPLNVMADLFLNILYILYFVIIAGLTILVTYEMNEFIKFVGDLLVR